MIIVLIGYMGSGKSSIGRRLADKIGYQHLDLDTFIEEQEKASVQDIFKIKGEIYFRKQEVTYLQDILNNRNNIILSTGGGTPCFGNNMALINKHKHTKSVYLKSSVSTLSEKLIRKKATRPLISHIETMEDMEVFIGKHLFERVPFYNQAKCILDTSKKTKKEVVKAIISKLF